jgi:hypothetical protein
MLEFLKLLEMLASHVNPANVESFISLVEGLVKLAESMKHPAVSPVVPVVDVVPAPPSA